MHEHCQEACTHDFIAGGSGGYSAFDMERDTPFTLGGNGQCYIDQFLLRLAQGRITLGLPHKTEERIDFGGILVFEAFGELSDFVDAIVGTHNVFSL